MPRTAILSTAALLLSCFVASAQTAPGAPGTNQVVPEKQAPPLNATPTLPPGDNLSDKLNKTGGVITAPAVGDSEMTSRPPAVGTMPVIKPPGSPGGPSGADPK